jgi:hypothetical protein
VGKIAIWPHTQEESMVSAAAAERFARDQLKLKTKSDETSLGYEAVFHNQAAAEVLCRACRRPDNLKVPFFPNPGELRRHLTDDEIAVLFAQYTKVRAEVGPMIARMEPEEYEAWVDRLAEAGDTFPLGFLSPEQHDHLTLYLASRCKSLRMATSSVGSQQSDSSPESTDLVPADTSTVTDEFGDTPDAGAKE